MRVAAAAAALVMALCLACAGAIPASAASLTTAAKATATSAKPTLSKKNLTVQAGKSETLKVENGSAYKVKKVAWASDKPAVAKVGKATGKVTGKKAGTTKVRATVKAKSAKTGKTKTFRLACTVKVKPKASGSSSSGNADGSDGADTSGGSGSAGNSDAGESSDGSGDIGMPGATEPGGGDSAQPSPSKTLVVYFSHAGENYSVGTVDRGNTAIVADKIAAKTGADTFEIVPRVPYTTDYAELVDVAQSEKEAGARPAYIGDVTDWDAYSTVFVGYPIWHGDLPMVVYTFLEAHDWTGKTVVPFNTHEGSGQAGTQSTVAGKCIGAEVKPGIAVRGATAQAAKDGELPELDAWLDGLGIDWAVGEIDPVGESEVGVFDLQARTVRMNSGYDMPVLGIGTYALSDTQAENSVYWALRDGYRLIDTARIYGNEAGVGRGIRRAIDEGIVKREDIFVTTKMWTSDYGNGAEAIEGSLTRLGLDYIDLMILHHSQPSNDVAAYKAMEAAVGQGKLRSIGLSNYYTAADFDRLVNATTIAPALLQNETHPYHQSTAMKQHIARCGTVMESWFPLGGRGNTATLFNDPVIAGIAAAHGKSSAQVILRWHLQAGNIAIPGSSNESHIAENVDVFDFALTDEEMQRMAALDKNQRFASY